MQETSIAFNGFLLTIRPLVNDSLLVSNMFDFDGVKIST